MQKFKQEPSARRNNTSGIERLKRGLLMRLSGRKLVSDEHSQLVEEIQNINAELARWQELARVAPADTREEDDCLGRIRDLEDVRFDRLSRLNGNHLEAYNALMPR